jgi:ribosomal protein L34E
MPPSKGKECASKGGHVLVLHKRVDAEKAFCHECGTQIFSSTELRPEGEVAPAPSNGHRPTRYWLAQGY